MTLDGLSGLSQLQQLSLKDNYLSASSTSSTSAGPDWAALPTSLRSLCLDSNGLRHLPLPASGLPQLHELTLSDNELQSLDPPSTPMTPAAAPTPAAARTPVLAGGGAAKEAASQLPGTSLALLAPCLSTLDLSGNCLVSLAGLAGCLNLASLDVSRNCLTSLQVRLVRPSFSAPFLSAPSLSAPPLSAPSLSAPSFSVPSLNDVQ